MRDLEIRGAGSLLGADQHGNMSAVGFDLYAQMLREAVSEARGETEVALPEVRVDVPVKAFLPEEYVHAADERVRYYRRFAAAATLDAVETTVAELVGRYGAMPEVASNLAGVARARAMAASCGATNVAVVRNRVVVQPVDLSGEARGKLATMGGVYLERERKVQLPLAYGEPVMNGVLGALAAILECALV
jgi:transcription-repair coupling factor (superfamily II helicase)